MLAEWSNRGAKYIAEKADKQFHVDVLQFGLHIFLQSCIKGAIWLGLALIFNALSVLGGVMLGYAITRAITGGVHAQTFVRCVVWSTGTMLLGLGITRILIPVERFGVIGILVMLSVGIMGCWITFFHVPIRWGKRKYTSRRIEMSKGLSYGWLMITLFTWVAIGLLHVNESQCAAFLSAAVIGAWIAYGFNLSFVRRFILWVEKEKIK